MDSLEELAPPVDNTPLTKDEERILDTLYPKTGRIDVDVGSDVSAIQRLLKRNNFALKLLFAILVALMVAFLYSNMCMALISRFTNNYFEERTWSKALLLISLTVVLIILTQITVGKIFYQRPRNFTRSVK